MSNQIYGNVFSTRTQRVLFVLEELDVQYDLQFLDFAKGEHMASAYVSEFHPFGKVPAFQDEKVKIFESRAICRYLTAKYPGPLTPPSTSTSSSGTVDAAYFDQAASVEQSYFEPPLEKLGFELIFKKMFGLGETDQEAVASQKSLLQKTLDYYDAILSSQEYLGGPTFGLVDIFTAPWFSFLEGRLNFEDEIKSRKCLEIWWAKVSGRPAWKRVLARLPH